jgi:GxxExxY protein
MTLYFDDKNKKKEYDLCGVLIGLAMKIHRELGPGFLENVYHQSLALELRKAQIPFESEKRIEVFYQNESVGYYDADLVINGKVVVEIKAVQNLILAHEVQLVHYLTATKKDEGLLLNFGSPSLEFKKKFRFSKTQKVSVNFAKNSVNFV